MGLLRTGKNKIRDYLASDLSYGELGTTGTDFDSGDTNLGTPDASTQGNLTITKSNQTVTTRHVLLSTVGNGNIYKEYANKFTDGVTFDRVVFPDYEKNSANELITIEVFRIE